ncbi:MAG: TfoX/Sxy family DNA transformation protein [Candidatus Nomurabacteria bacterium]|nr:MAG: TfoX/Sxy family DNA transformation protein [Candidatus Nomurabacteria bacterium]
MPRTLPKDVLLEIPGVGKSIAKDLHELNIHKVEDLRRQNPEQLYENLQRQQGAPIDRCILYVFRCAVYYASHTRHDVEKLKWWNWKD